MIVDELGCFVFALSLKGISYRLLGVHDPLDEYYCKTEAPLH